MELTDDTRLQPIASANRRARNGAFRPPWSTEMRIRHACTSCADCIRSCPEAILVAGPAGTPVVDFSLGACTFCEACAVACKEDVFDLSEPPWQLKAVLQNTCLLHQGVTCRSCTDVCEISALRFDLHSGPVGQVKVDATRCNGCGACLSMCPVSAITLQTILPKEKATA